MDYSVVNSLEIWELNNLKNLLCCTFINTNIYTQKNLFLKDEVCSSLMIDHNLLWAGFFGVLAKYISIKV